MNTNRLLIGLVHRAGGRILTQQLRLQAVPESLDRCAESSKRWSLAAVLCRRTRLNASNLRTINGRRISKYLNVYANEDVANRAIITPLAQMNRYWKQNCGQGVRSRLSATIPEGLRGICCRNFEVVG